MEIHHDLYQLLDEMSVDMDLADSFQRASLQPPITHESLSELDIARIVNNPDDAQRVTVSSVSRQYGKALTELDTRLLDRYRI